ncbi:hypothetical protein EI555_005801, partial [Monodon monoceros]
FQKLNFLDSQRCYQATVQLCFIPELAADKVKIGATIRPLRHVDPTQTEYQGMIEIMDEVDMKGEVYPFGIVGMANKGDCLQKGESVKATVECVKDQFGFINYEVGDSKKLFFHVKEVQDGIELQAGDEVEFSVIFNQRTGKCSACNNITLDDARAPCLVVLRQPRGLDNSVGFGAERKIC